MALTQMQLIQSLGEAMAGVARARVAVGGSTHGTSALCGRIGELYVAPLCRSSAFLKVSALTG